MNYSEMSQPYSLKEHLLLPALYLNDPTKSTFDFTSVPTAHFSESNFDSAAHFGWQRPPVNTSSSFSSGDSFESTRSSDVSAGPVCSPLLSGAIEERLSGDGGAVIEQSLLKPEMTFVKSGPTKRQGKRPGRKPHAEDRPKKPEETYIVLIGQAISAQESKRATLNEIYAWLRKNHPFFEGKYDGWKNSIRHNLSLNQCFKKLEKSDGNTKAGKGHYWSLNPDYPIEKASQMAKRFKLPIHSIQKKPRATEFMHKERTTMDLSDFTCFGEVDKIAVNCFAEQCPQPVTGHFMDSHSNNNQILDGSAFSFNEYPNYLLSSNGAFGYQMSGGFQTGIWPTSAAMDGNSTGLLMPIPSQMNTYQTAWDPKSNSLDASPSHVANPTNEFQSQIQVIESQKEEEEQLEVNQPGGIPGIDTIYTAGPVTNTQIDFQSAPHTYTYPNPFDFNPQMVAHGQFVAGPMHENFCVQQNGEFVAQPTLQYELSSSTECPQY